MGKKKWKRFIPVALAAAVLAGAGIWQAAEPKEVTNYDVEFEAEQEAPEQETAGSSSGGAIQIPGYKSISIPAGTRDVEVELMNPEQNEVYFEISFYLPETDETIYTSKMIRPGQHLYEITLEREMEAGEYPLIVRYATYSADEAMTPRNGAEVNCTLAVSEQPEAAS